MESQDIMMNETSSSSSSTENSSSSSSIENSSSSSTEYSLSLSTSAKPNVTKTKTNKRRLISCGMILHTNLDDEFICFAGKVTDHSHLPNPAQLEIRNLRETMRKRAENELLPLQEIAEQ
ncbi:unnamed protein product [Rotaria sordida]|uniref:Uncharacterized protein n=1 Tax=Rotaria sordida TaxID=392033 RepID=A0A815T2N1_9BILA|nr:unnamed protein product [Rotaria sordida]CAF4169112.1 unnamed protein product [Rotaria sordida]